MYLLMIGVVHYLLDPVQSNYRLFLTVIEPVQFLSTPVHCAIRLDLEHKLPVQPFQDVPVERKCEYRLMNSTIYSFF